MHLTSFIALVALMGVPAGQDSFSFERAYVVGEKDVYSTKLSMESGLGSFDISMDRSERVAKVYPNGDADIETEISNLSVLMNGEPLQGGTSGGAGPQKTSEKVDKYGRPSASGASRGGTTGASRRGGLGGAEFMRYMSLGEVKSIKVGETVSLDHADAQNPKTKVKGKATLVSIEAGVAKVQASIQVTQEGSSKPVQATFTSFYDVATKKLNRTEGTLSDLPPMGQMTVEAMQIVITRKP